MADRTTVRRVTLRDDTLPHQIRIKYDVTAGTHRLVVTCTCLAILARQSRFDSHEPMEIWRAHMAEVAA